MRKPELMVEHVCFVVPCHLQLHVVYKCSYMHRCMWRTFLWIKASSILNLIFLIFRINMLSLMEIVMYIVKEIKGKCKSFFSVRAFWTGPVQFMFVELIAVATCHWRGFNTVLTPSDPYWPPYWHPIKSMGKRKFTRAQNCQWLGFFFWKIELTHKFHDGKFVGDFQLSSPLIVHV